MRTPGHRRRISVRRRHAHLGLRQPGVDEHDIRAVALERSHGAHGVTHGGRELKAVGDADESREALAHASIRIDDEHANGTRTDRSPSHGGASRRRTVAHRRMAASAYVR